MIWYFGVFYDAFSVKKCAGLSKPKTRDTMGKRSEGRPSAWACPHVASGGQDNHSMPSGLDLPDQGVESNVGSRSGPM